MPTESEDRGIRLQMVRVGQSSRITAHRDMVELVADLRQSSLEELKEVAEAIESKLRVEHNKVAFADEYAARRRAFEKEWQTHVRERLAERSALLTRLKELRTQMKKMRPRRGRRKNKKKPLNATRTSTLLNG